MTTQEAFRDEGSVRFQLVEKAWWSMKGLIRPEIRKLYTAMCKEDQGKLPDAHTLSVGLSGLKVRMTA